MAFGRSLQPSFKELSATISCATSCSRWSWEWAWGRDQRETFVSAVTFIFSVPFLLFSMTGGWLADRFSKRQVTIWTKVMEFGSMLLATA